METVIIIQSEEFVRDFFETDNVNHFIIECLLDTKSIGRVLIKEFDTTQEKKAYLQGFEDCEGWIKNHLIENKAAKEIADYVKSNEILI